MIWVPVQAGVTDLSQTGTQRVTTTAWVVYLGFFLTDILPFLPSLQSRMEVLLQEAASGELLTSSDHNAISQSHWGKRCLQNCWRLLNVRKWDLTSK